MSFWAKALIVAVLLVVVAVVWARRASSAARTRELRAIAARCSGAPASAPILVLIATSGSGADWAHAARAVHSAFDGADCPFRVSVALYERVAPSDAHVVASAAATGHPEALREVITQATPVMAAYTTLARGGRYGRSFADQVRAFRVAPGVTSAAAAGADGGAQAARAALMAAAYRGQAFVLTLSPTAVLLPHWDTQALAALAAVHDPHALIVAPPAVAPGTWLADDAADAVPGAATAGGVRLRRGPDAWSLAASTLLGESTPAALANAHTHAHAHAPGAERGAVPCVPRFPVLDSVTGGLPSVTSRAMARPVATAPPVPVLFWTGDCAFGPARAFARRRRLDAAAVRGWGTADDDVPPFPAPFDAALAGTLPAEDDAVMSARLWTRGWRFYAPQEALAVLQRPVWDDGDSGGRGGAGTGTADAARQVLLAGEAGPHLHTVAEWQAFVGVHVATDAGSGRARMGATPAPTTDEVVAKFDSWTAFSAERSVYA